MTSHVIIMAMMMMIINADDGYHSQKYLGWFSGDRTTALGASILPS